MTLLEWQVKFSYNGKRLLVTDDVKALHLTFVHRFIWPELRPFGMVTGGFCKECRGSGKRVLQSTLCLKKNDNDVAHYNFNVH